MARRSVTPDVVIEDGDFLVVTPADSAPVRRGGPAAVASNEDLRSALRGADFEIAAEFVATPPAEAPPIRRGEALAQPRVSVAVAPGEAAVLLYETEGGVLAGGPGGARVDAPPGRRGVAAPRGGRVETIFFDPAPPRGAPPEPARRGPLTDWFVDKAIEPVRTYVLRFVVTRAIDAAVARIEGDNPLGPVVIRDLDAAKWVPAPIDFTYEGKPPVRILLMVHGTFSSTMNSFGALTASKNGVALMRAAFDTYDLILGHDHRTLADTPETNATAILATLAALKLPAGSSIDAVGFSRGGLVLRTLLETLLPKSGLDVTLGKAIFVGCTNGGTQLASPANWVDLTDLYTNIAVAAGKGVAMLTGGTASPLVTLTIRTLGRFVQLFSQVAIGERKLPGLAAMEPGGDVVAALNTATTPNPAVAYHAITSSFEPGLTLARGLTAEATRFLADRITDRLMKEPNDLVVNTASMTEFGSRQELLAADATLALGDTANVYHTIYFADEGVAGQISGWLGLDSLGLPQSGSLVSGDSWTPRMAEEERPRGITISDRVEYESEPTVRGAASVTRVPPGPPPELSDDESMPDLPRHPVSTRRGGGDGFAMAEPPGEMFESMKSAEPPAVEAAPMAAAPAAEPVSAAAPEPETVERFIAAEMAPQPKLGTPVNVWVAISAAPIAVADHAAADSTDVAAKLIAKAPLRIEIIPRRNCRVIGDDAREFDISGDQINTRFEVEGIAQGEAELIIEARQGVRVVASFILKPVFVGAEHAVMRVEQPINPDPPAGEGFAVLRIYEFKRPGGITLRFDIVSDDPVFARGGTLEIDGFDMGAYVGEVLREIEDAWNLKGEGGAADIYNSFRERLADKAKIRTEALIPEGIRRELWKNRDKIEAIQIISEDAQIPWELMFLTDPDRQSFDDEGFLSEWGLVRWLHGAPMPGRQLGCAGTGCRYVIPTYQDAGKQLKGAQDEKTMLEQLFAGIAAVPATSRDVSRYLEREAQDCDILHFACHGLAEQRAVLDSKLLMEGQVNAQGKVIDDPLSIEQVKARARFKPGTPRALVFLNACQAGREGEGLAGVSGFADSFIRPLSGQGVAAFVGALWSVDDRLALNFAETFYRELKDGKTIVEATRAARKAADAKHDFTWLAYTVYGNPFARMR